MNRGGIVSSNCDADLVFKSVNGTICSKKVTYDFARLMDGGTEIKCSAFGDNMIAHM